MERTKIDRWSARRLPAAIGCCVVQATLMACGSLAAAAESEPEEIVVTGSRIRQNPVDRVAPLQTATAADIDRSGEVSVADYLQRLPISGSAINRSNNSSGNSVQGRFIFLDPRVDANGDGNPDRVDITIDTGVLNDGVTRPIYDPSNPTGADFRQFGTADRFNFRPYNYLVTPNRRVNLFAKAEYDVADNIDLRITAAYTNRESTNQAAPNPLPMGSDASSTPGPRSSSERGINNH